MEEAYTELYQQFLRLRSLCLKQAALLHQLTTALQKQQGVSAPEVDVTDLISIPVQCSYEIPACLYEKPQPLTSKGPDPAQPCGADHSSRNVGCASGILAEGMSKLSVDMPCQRKQDAKMEMLNPFMFNLESSKYHGASSCKTKPSEQNGPGDNRAQYTVKMPMTDGGLLNLSGVGMMSDVALHSHICEFCQAVFPGDSTTRGEFLRHLYTHVT
ncbi:uncharacterized protein zgc:113184 [Girardinichthys multiradiatus]|uniref:uncharacterized protein zgc:113184 n=1 Tax=Girardinichthys multiradiatus TaxID=208333 RepID=UPI001FABE2E9|nr:uncharacterized protein zgc:113184 [Girardinichthys multiradiatus]XP_047203990.1 uncharacterized protein zgc:113184 [Girardinichthys multiradiatus]XP_047203992.1 uncharacterized protein zgc:113184 [Girardinichthys multiradiatus]XP_047203993.1 uncharacterized protein zgc:113184 [Girardinichthys multiradiatus]